MGLWERLSLLSQRRSVRERREKTGYVRSGVRLTLTSHEDIMFGINTLVYLCKKGLFPRKDVCDKAHPLAILVIILARRWSRW
jgi:hypothetical protein